MYKVKNVWTKFRRCYMIFRPGRVAQLVAYLTRDLEVTGSIPGCGDILSGDFSIASHL